MGKEDVVVVNQYNSASLEQRTAKSGRVRYVITTKSEPVAFNLDPKQIGANVTAAIIQHLRQAVKSIAAQAAPRTIKAREVEARAYAKGKAWALKRYSGGKTGATPPSGDTRALNASGRLANSITASPSSDGNYRINVAANRINAATGNVQRIWTRLVELVPEIGNPELLLKNDIVRKGIEKARDNIVSKGVIGERDLFRKILGIAAQRIGELDDLFSAAG